MGAFRPLVEPGRVLRGYSWDGVARVPWLGDRAPEELLFGELGRTSLTGLYLTFNQDLAAEAALQPEGWSVELRAGAPSPGRFGQGLRLGPDARLRAALPVGSRGLRAWTVEFWLFPQAFGKRELLAVPGLLALRTDASGKLVLELPGAGAVDGSGAQSLVVAHPQALLAGQWNHVGIVLDLQDARGVRMVLNGVPRGSKLDPAFVSGEALELVLGDVTGRANGLECVLDELRFLARNTSTDELEAHWKLERKPVERLQLDYATGGEELELWRAPLTDARLDSPEEWASGELAHACASPAGLRWTSEYWRRVECPDRPVARTTHPVVYLGGRLVFTFGGETRDTHWGRGPNTNDTWIYDGAAGSWSRVATPVAPSPRCHMIAAYSPDHDLVLLVGGWWQGGWWQGAPPEVRMNDVWVFHVGERRWEPRSAEGLGLEVVNDNGLVYLPEQRRFLLLMGRSVRLYDPEANRWEALPDLAVVKQDGRAVRGFTTLAYSAVRDADTGLVLVFGGSSGREVETFHDETGIYDPRANTLTLLDLPVHPAARVRPALAYDPVRKRFVLFGGVRDQRSQRFDDLWTFDPRTRTWSEVERGAERPSARGGFMGMAYDDVADHFVVPDGRHAFERWLDETWTLELDETRAGRARYVFDRAAFPQADTWFAELETPAGSAVRLRFRPSSDGLRFGPWSEACPKDGRYVQVEVVLEPGAGGASPLVHAMGFRAGR